VPRLKGHTHTLGKVGGIKVYLKLKAEDAWMECDLFDAPLPGVPPELHVLCPECYGDVLIPPAGDPGRKTISVEIVDPPRVLTMPDSGEQVVQVRRVTVEEVCTCPWPAKNGKGICGWRFKITDNVISRAGR
jgi:hypothetical protein